MQITAPLTLTCEASIRWEGTWRVTTFITKEIIMNKMTIAIFALMLAALGGCASNGGGGDGIGAGVLDAYDASGPFPRGIVMQADG